MELKKFAFITAISLIILSVLINGIVLFDLQKNAKQRITGNALGEISLCVDIGEPPVLDSIGDLNATEGIIFNYTLNATGDLGTLHYFDNATFFDINETTGLIEFTPLSSDVGTHSVKLWVTYNVCSDRYDYEIITFTVYSSGEETQSSAVSSFSGGGGGKPASAEIGIIEEKNSWDTIEKGESVLFEVKDKNIGVETITFSVNKETKKVAIAVKNLGSWKLEKPDKLTYKYFEIKTDNLNQNNLDFVFIDFSVSNEWLKDKKIESVALAKYNEKIRGWVYLPTQKLTEEKDYTYFKAKTDSFSYFAITAESTVTKTSEKEMFMPHLKKCDDICSLSDIPDCILDCWRVGLVLFALLIIIIGILITFSIRIPSFREEEINLQELKYYISLIEKKMNTNKEHAKEIFKRAKRKYNLLRRENRIKFKMKIREIEAKLRQNRQIKPRIKKKR